VVWWCAAVFAGFGAVCWEHIGGFEEDSSKVVSEAVHGRLAFYHT